MFKNIFENIEGISIFPVISLILFMAIFIFIIVWIIRLKKEDVNEMKNIPLNDNLNDS